MKYLSVCSGIEAASVAWKDFGWEAVGFSEIEKFPSEVLKHHYPTVTNFGDMTKYKEWNLESIDILVGGTPCQSFSVAGLRKGLEDPRGNLMLTYCGLLDKFRPKWFIWENVPGVLSSSGGRDFGSFLGAVEELGYGFAYRVLDAQYFGVAQRRKRVFVVGCLGDWQSAAKVLFEPESLRRDSPPSREKRKETAARTGVGVEISGPLSARDYKDAGTDGLNEYSAKMVPVGYTSDGFASYKEGVGTLRATSGDLGGGSETFVTDDATKQFVYENHPSDSRVKEMGDICQTVTSRWGTGGGNVPIALAENTIGRLPQNGGNGDGFTEGGPMYTLNATGVHGIAYGFEPGITKREGNPSRFLENVTPTLRAHMGDNQTATAYSIDTYVHGVAQPMVLMDQGGSVMNVMQDGTVGTLRSETHGHEPLVMDKSVAFDTYNHSVSDVNQTLKSPQGGVSESIGTVLSPSMAVRRLTPLECERLQGFPTVSERVIIEVCLDPQNRSASAALKCHKWQNSAWPANESGLTQPASIAGIHSSMRQAGQEPLAALHVQLLYGHTVRVTRNAGRSILYASGAEAFAKSPPSTEIENTAAELAPLLHELVNEALSGRAASPHNIRLSFPALSGETSAEKYGQGTEGLASDAENGQKQATFTTSDLGLITTCSDSTAGTLCCSVLRAIAGCIPSETLPARFSIELTVEAPYTDIKPKGKDTPDGLRYKALGNSMAVPVMAWIGKRIQMVGN